jgi:geranylgeranyl diphosphate synthase type II
VDRALAAYARITQQAVLSYLPDLEPSDYLYALLPDYPLRSGKGVRPALCLATCQAFGGSIEDALDAAAAIELLHNAFLVHDDIADESTLRRGRRTLHAVHGVPLALNAGDALAFLSLQPLLKLVRTAGWDARGLVDSFQETISRTLEGQAEELGWIRDNVTDLTVGDYLSVTLRKTGWYTAIQPCRVGAHIATGGRVGGDRFLRFGFFLGTAFQLRDDLLGVRGDGLNDGAGEDVLEGKRTLMLIHLLHRAPPPERAFVRDFLGRPRADRSPEDAMRVVHLMRVRGSVAYGEQWLRALARRADEEFAFAYQGAGDSEHTRFIRGLLPYLLSPAAGT